MPAPALYVGYPSALLHHLAGGADTPTTPPPARLKPKKHLLWGDELKLLRESADGALLLVEGRKTRGWIRREHTQAQRLLEIVFVDIGQGDGAMVVTPANKRYVIDAGQGDNMLRFLRWRFGFDKKFVFDAAIVSHSDQDHYGGFADLFEQPNVSFRRVYTNGLMERQAAGSSGALGELVSDGGERFITDLVGDLTQLRAFLADPARWTGKKYPTMLAKALQDQRFADFRRLSAADGFLPGHGKTAALQIELLGPVTEPVNGAPALRWFSDVGRTKNGHSVVLRLKLKNVTIFLGGDLNAESSRHLLHAHTGLDAEPATPEAEAALVAAARPRFGSDVAKACHHGSADTLLPLMKAIHPLATVVSSGDDEPYAHPRADALGAIAKCSRGDRPLLLSTELARSAKETIKHPQVLREQLKAASAAVAAAPAGSDERKQREKDFADLVARIDRSVAVFGAINLRTDGERVLLAYKMERSTASKGWDIYLLEPETPGGPLVYRSKHD